MTTNAKNQLLINARKLLRSEQQNLTNLDLSISNKQLKTNASLKALEKLVAYVPAENPTFVKRGLFKYERDLEDRRIERAQNIINRVAPGPLEDPNYFAMLAYQAASIEMAYEHMLPKVTEQDRFTKFLLGTIHAPEVNAFSEKVTINGFTNVMLNSGLVDFIYQAAKVIAEVMNPSYAADGSRRISAKFDLEEIRTRLTVDSPPVVRLYRTLEAYFFLGYPRASEFESIPDSYSPMLSMTVSLAERWIIGHEYGHGLAPLLGAVPDGVNAYRAEEYFSDFHATIATVFSACSFDAVPPEFPLSGGIFVLECLDLLQKGLLILKTGEEKGFDYKNDTHPPNRERAVEIINVFRRFFDVNYFPEGNFDLDFILRSETPKTHNFSIEHSGRAYAHAKILEVLWFPLKELLLEDFRHERPLHKMWC